MSDSDAIPFYGLPIVGWKIFQLSRKNHLISLFKHDNQPWHILGSEAGKRAEDPKASCRAPVGRYEGMMLPPVGGIRRERHEPPGELCSCVVPETLVEGVGNIRRAYKMPYRGPLAVLKTASGNELTVTINHPILTARGWVPAKSIRKGDHVIRRTGVGPSLPGEDVEEQPTPITEIFSAISELAAADELINRVLMPLDFHGDGQFVQGNVDIVSLDGFLGGAPNPVPQEVVVDDSLGVSPRGALQSRSSPGVRGGSHVELGGSNFDTSAVPDSVAQGPVANTSLLGETINSLAGEVAFYVAIEIGDTNEEGLRTGSGVNTDSLESVEEPTGRHAALFSELISRFAGLVAAEEVVEVRDIREWAGHVYDLSTTQDMYFADSILTHNCGFYSYNSPEAALEDPTVGSNFFKLLTDESGLEKIRYGYCAAAYSYMQQRGVLALVQNYGRFYTNQLSTRSERVRIAAICSQGGPSYDTLAQLAEEMGVPLMSFTEMREFSEIAGISV